MKRILILITVITLFSCSKNKESKTIEKEVSIIEVEKPKHIEHTNINYCELCLTFLNDYQVNYDKIYERDFINYEVNFSINFDNLEYFIKETQMTKFFTKKYITNFKNNIKSIDDKLKRTPQNDGTIDGLESDMFLLTQEIEDCLNQIESRNIRCSIIDKNKVEINFKNGHSLMFLIKENKIDDIALKSS